MFVQLKGRLRRIDATMSREDFGIFLAKNYLAATIGVRLSGATTDDGGAKPLYLWNYFLWDDVRKFRQAAFVVKDEYVEEIIGSLLMFGELVPAKVDLTPLQRVMCALDLKAQHFLVLPQHKVGGKVSLSRVAVPDALALQTDKCWMVYPLNINAVNSQLSGRRKR